MSELSRGSGSRPPVRMVHLGLGNFFRAHQAWYTDHSPDASAWGIAAFTGRRPGLAPALVAQEGLYTLVTRDSSGDAFEVVRSLVGVHAAAEHDAWLGHFACPDLAVVTLTVTEAAYLRGSVASDPAARDDVEALRADRSAPVSSVPGRLVAGLLARASAGLGPLAIVPCDNLPGNGSVARDVVRELAGLVDPGLVSVVEEQASYVTTMVDRITPRTTPEDLATVRSGTGVDDAAPVVTEPFSEWVLSGSLPAGRPAWDQAGTRFVDDVAPYEQRKLWLLNGAHSLLAYAGSIRGHALVAEAIADPACAAHVEQWWDDAGPYLSLPADEIGAYREALLARWANPRIRHLLAQIAADGSQKVPVRVLPVLRAARADGRVPLGATRILAAWLGHLRGHGAPIDDAGAAPYVAAAAGPPRAAVHSVLALLDPALADDAEVVSAVLDQLDESP